jgi:hypothetical protein
VLSIAQARGGLGKLWVYAGIGVAIAVAVLLAVFRGA